MSRGVQSLCVRETTEIADVWGARAQRWVLPYSSASMMAAQAFEVADLGRIGDDLAVLLDHVTSDCFQMVTYTDWVVYELRAASHSQNPMNCVAGASGGGVLFCAAHLGRQRRWST